MTREQSRILCREAAIDRRRAVFDLRACGLIGIPGNDRSDAGDIASRGIGKYRCRRVGGGTACTINNNHIHLPAVATCTIVSKRNGTGGKCFFQKAECFSIHNEVVSRIDK